MIAVQCVNGHLVEVTKDDPLVQQSSCGFLDPEACPECRANLAPGDWWDEDLKSLLTLGGAIH